jgi:transketolase
MRDAFVKGLVEVAQNDERIYLITADLGFGVLNEFQQRCPNQFLNVGIAEQNMIGVATGLALDGHIVFTYSIANFAFMRCLEQIRNDAAYHYCNVNVVAVGGGLSYGPLGVSHHATEDFAIMRSIPEITVISPGDDYEASLAADAACHRQGVSYIRLGRNGNYKTLDCSGFAIGSARTVREGTDVTLIASGDILAEAITAADSLDNHGVSCRVISMHTLNPLDTNALRAAAQETGGIVTIEEHTINGGLGGAVAEFLLESGCVPGFFRRIGLRMGFSATVGTQDFLRQQYEIDAQAITKSVRTALAANGHC